MQPSTETPGGLESRIRFYWVLALTIAHLMRRKAEHNGLYLSVRELLATFGGIEGTVSLHDGNKGRPRARRMLTDQNPTQKPLADLFDSNA